MTRIIYQIHAQLLMTVVDLKWKGPDDSKPLDTSYTPAEARAMVRVATMDHERDGDDVDESGGEESDGKEGDGNMTIEPDCKFLWDVKV